VVFSSVICQATRCTAQKITLVIQKTALAIKFVTMAVAAGVFLTMKVANACHMITVTSNVKNGKCRTPLNAPVTSTKCVTILISVMKVYTGT